VNIDTGQQSNSEETWLLRLYIAGQTPKSMAALANLRKLCESQPEWHYEIEVVDLMEHPERAKMDQVVAIPTLVRRLPTPLKKLIGDLSDREKVLRGLEVVPLPS
jgi:circadian clock protein KaiB